MRKSPESARSNVLHLPAQTIYPRRSLAPLPGNMTCMVLVQHGESDKALFVSACGDFSKAVWCPKAMLIVEPNARENFIVATMPKIVAEQKGLSPYASIDESWLSPQALDALNEAKGIAARNRNRLRRYKGPMGWSGGRNVFA